MSNKLLLAGFIFVLSVMSVTAADNPLPAPTGNYKVGVEWRHWIDTSRDEIFDKAPHGKREMMVEILYPANPSGDAKPGAYMVNKQSVLAAFTDLASENGIPYAPKVEDVDGLQSHSYTDAPLSDGQARYPVLVFSHGAGGEVTIYTAQLEDLASHGYIVVAINHAYGAASTVFPDGRTVHYDLSKGLDGTAPIWSKDQIFVIDQLEKVNASDPNNRFTGHLDLNNLGVFGHSLGGSTATITCQVDKRCKAGANEDGPVFGDVTEKGLQQPFMYLLTDHHVFYTDGSYSQVAGPYYEVTVKGTEHFNYGDWGFWKNIKSLQDSFWLGSIDSARGIQIHDTYLLAFFDKYLKGIDGTLLSDMSANFPEVSIKSQNVMLPKFRLM